MCNIAFFFFSFKSRLSLTKNKFMVIQVCKSVLQTDMLKCCHHSIQIWFRMAAQVAAVPAYIYGFHIDSVDWDIIDLIDLITVHPFSELLVQKVYSAKS